MSFDRPLHGGCQCGRNVYTIQFPKDSHLPSSQLARVLFNSSPSHRSLAAPLSAFLRVPLQYYHSRVVPSFPDETFSQIHKAYTSPAEAHSKRYFCGFCGTPLSYWSEEPQAEKDFINLTLGSLAPRDLADLEEMGLLPSSESEDTTINEEEDDDDENKVMKRRKEGEDTPMRHVAEEDDETDEKKEQAVRKWWGNNTTSSLSWFDTLTEGSLLGGRLRTTSGKRQNKNSTVRVEFEIVEWEEGGDGDDATPESPRVGKRKLAEVAGGGGGRSGAMEGIQH